MNLSGNTILITGGGSGIGRGLAEQLQKQGSQVIIAGRRKQVLEEVIAANPGMQYVVLDTSDAASIAEAVPQLVKDFPKLNVLINNAGIMRGTVAGAGPIDEGDLTATIDTNLLGPIRLTGALLDQLKSQAAGENGAAVMNVTSGLAFTPLAPVSVYCATKAALHSYTLSLRFDLRKTEGFRVLELVPPYVQTELYNGANDPRAMPLDQFIAEVMQILATDTDEVSVGRVAMLRPKENAAKEAEGVTRFNEMMAADPH